MDVFTENNLRSLILEILSKGPLKAVVLIEQIQKKRLATRQAVYLALRGLIKDEVVVKYRKKVMLNQIWINKLGEFVKDTDKNYTFQRKGSREINELDSMREGDKISYIFNNFHSQDIFYSHLFSLLIKKTNSRSPVYIYNPHEWFIFFREKNEKYLFDWLRKNGHQLYLMLGHKTDLDRSFRDEFNSDEVSIDIDEKANFPENYYLNIVGNYVTETTIDKRLAQKINLIYENSKTESEADEKIKELMKRKNKIKTVVSFNSQKARKFKTKFAKDFFIPKELKKL
jgi:hypothetical protein